MKPKTIVIIVLAVLAAIIIIQNSAATSLRILLWSTTGPLIFLVLGVFAIGVVIGYLAGKVDRKRRPKPSVGSGPAA
ncbi:MAG: lipopolysaccharide assembly protein LapA domain-containing protein [Candidatus Aminicenantales bacterium]